MLEITKEIVIPEQVIEAKTITLKPYSLRIKWRDSVSVDADLSSGGQVVDSLQVTELTAEELAKLADFMQILLQRKTETEKKFKA